MAVRHVLAELTADYEQQSGQRVTIVTVGGVDAAKRVEGGEAFDIVVLAADAIERLAARRLLVPDGRIDFARSGVAIAVAAGAKPPDISSEAAVREAVLRSRRIGYSTGPSGVHLLRLFERWGIADRMAPRSLQAPPGVPVATLVARGDVELGFQQLSELIDVPGIDVIGPLPPEIQAVTIFSGAACTASTRPAAASALLSFLASRKADAAKHRFGLEPV